MDETTAAEEAEFHLLLCRLLLCIHQQCWSSKALLKMVRCFQIGVSVSNWSAPCCCQRHCGYHSYKHDKHEGGGRVSLSNTPSITFDTLVTGMVRGAGALLLGPELPGWAQDHRFEPNWAPEPNLPVTLFRSWGAIFVIVGCKNKCMILEDCVKKNTERSKNIPKGKLCLLNTSVRAFVFHCITECAI